MRILKIFLLLTFAFVLGCTDETEHSQIAKCEPDNYQKDFLIELNKIRRTPKYCGGAYYVSADPVAFSCKLEPASRIHSKDMASTGIVRHVGSNGVGLYGRLAETDYSWLNAGEAIAAGPSEPGKILTKMMSESRGCRVIMDPNFSASAVYRESVSDPEPKSYWTLILASPT